MRAAAKKSLIAGVSVAAVGLAAATAVSTLANPEPKPVRVAAAADGTGIAGQYIVTLKKGASIGAQTRSYQATEQFDGVLHGFAARLTPAQLQRLRRNPQVAAIEQDSVMRATDTQRPPLPWGLDRIDQRSLPLSKSYTYKSTGAGVTVYIIDTGINTAHVEFGGRASVGYDSVGDGKPYGQDCLGHGTHVAGIVGSSVHGVAKGVNLVSVRVLGCDGSGVKSKIIKGINWVKAHHAARSVANLSLGGGKSTAVNNAVTALSKAGVFVTVAAGNGDENGTPLNACSTSPASAGSVEAVGATTGSDRRTSWSNYGKCVDILAPGNNIASTWKGSTTATATISGTSMAAPHVAGVVALCKAKYGNKSFGTIQKWLTAHSTQNKLKGLLPGTPNRLLNTGGL